jgi:hypothetical protein
MCEYFTIYSSVFSHTIELYKQQEKIKKKGQEYNKQKKRKIHTRTLEKKRCMIKFKTKEKQEHVRQMTNS